MRKRQLYIVGGANGSGKTTFARQFAAQKKLAYLAADDIAAQFPSKRLADVAIKAARVLSRKLDEQLQTGRSFVIESTLSGLSLQKHLSKAKELKYQLKIIFLYLDSPEHCVKRVVSRVAAGGHDVSTQDIIRRFKRANHNFWHRYRLQADSWALFYNAGDSFQQIALGEKREITIIDNARFEVWAKMVNQ